MRDELISNVIQLDQGAGRNLPGHVYAANEDRFDASTYSEPLTTYGVGFPDSDGFQAALDNLFAPVQVPRKFEFKKADSAEAFVSELDDVRAIGDKGFKRIEYGGESVTAKTFNKGLTIVLDKDEMVAGDEERAVARLKNRLLRNELRRGVALYVGSATNTGKTWNTSSDPDMDIMADLNTGNLASGVQRNRVIFGSTAWTKRVLAYRANDKAGSFASATMSMEQVAAFLGVDLVALCKEFYKTGKGKTNTEFMASYVFMAHVSNMADREDPSNAKRFFTPTESGPFRVYRQEFNKTIELSMEHYSVLTIPTTLGLRMFTIA